MRLTINAQLVAEEDNVYTADYLSERVHAHVAEVLEGATVELRGSDTAEITVDTVEVVA